MSYVQRKLFLEYNHNKIKMYNTISKHNSCSMKSLPYLDEAKRLDIIIDKIKKIKKIASSCQKYIQSLVILWDPS